MVDATFTTPPGALGWSNEKTNSNFWRNLFDVVRELRHPIETSVFWKKKKVKDSAKYRGVDFPRVTRVTRPSTVRGCVDIPLTRTRFSSEHSVSVAPTSRTSPVRPMCPETFVLGNSERPMYVFAPQNVGLINARTQKGYCLIFLVCIHPCIKSDTLSPRNRVSGTVKGFSSLWFQVRFSGVDPLCRVPEYVFCIGKLPSYVIHICCCPLGGRFWSHVFLKSTSWTDFDGGMVEVVLELPSGLVSPHSLFWTWNNWHFLKVCV